MFWERSPRLTIALARLCQLGPGDLSGRLEEMPVAHELVSLLHVFLLELAGRGKNRDSLAAIALVLEPGNTLDMGGQYSLQQRLMLVGPMNVDHNA